MRVDSLAPKTWLLTAVAVWALCLWVLAMAGMGRRLGDAGEDVAQQRLPTTTLPNGERPGPLALYSEIAARPLFSDNRRPQPFTIDGNGQEAPSNPFDYILTSVLIAPQVQLAILRSPGDDAKPVRVKLGEAVESAPQWSLASLEPRQAVFRGPEGEKILDLRVFNGIGAIMPMPAMVNPGMPVPPTPVPPGPPMPVAGTMPPPGAVPPGAVPPGAVPPGAIPQPDGTVPPPVPANGDVSTQAQLEAIRKRIEARRAQLRQQNQSGQNPPTR
jgi:general secretion pathway protein N